MPSYSTQAVQRLVSEAAQRHGVPESLALSVARAESSFNQDAVSGAGAIGVMQLMPPTAQDLGVNPYDLEQNIDGGVRYLGWLLGQFGGDQQKALAAYNYGIGNVKSGKSWPQETRTYVSRVLGYAGDHQGGTPIPSLTPTSSSPDIVASIQSGGNLVTKPDLAALGSAETLLLVLVAAGVFLAVD